MDKLIFETKTGRWLVSKLLSKIFSEKFDTETLIMVNELSIEHDGEIVEFHISCDGKIRDSRKLQALL